MHPLIQLRQTTAAFLVAFALALFALLPNTQAVSPPPDGAYPGENTAEGGSALLRLTNGLQNTAIGSAALSFNTTGNHNTAVGSATLVHNMAGSDNTAVGISALNFSTGSDNVGLGSLAGENLHLGNGNVYIGAGVRGGFDENNTTRIRNVYSSIANGRAVYVDSDNKIGTLSSSHRFKEEIKPMDKASEVILALKPVTFRYKKEIDPAQTLSFGLIAEEVAQINGDLVTRDEKGKPETVRYEAVNAMLLNEFLKEHRAFVQEQRKVEQLEKQLEAVAAGLQKVSAQLELRKPTPQTVVNNQ